MLLPSAIQRSDDFVGMATPMVPLSPLPELLPPQAARLRARAAPATPAINLRTEFLPFVARPAGALPGVGGRSLLPAQTSEPLRESVVRLVPAQLLAEPADRGGVVDHDQLGAGHVGQVAEVGGVQRGGQHRVVR